MLIPLIKELLQFVPGLGSGTLSLNVNEFGGEVICLARCFTDSREGFDQPLQGFLVAHGPNCSVSQRRTPLGGSPRQRTGSKSSSSKKNIPSYGFTLLVSGTPYPPE